MTRPSISLENQLTLENFELNILPGFKCGFRCAHCAVGPELETEGRLSQEEIRILKRTINEFRPSIIAFAGGEPTYYIDEINDLVSVHPTPEKLTVRLTTNGQFARDKARALSTLGAFKKLDQVQLSYDRFHEDYFPLEMVGHVASACKELSLDFGVLLAMTSPLDLEIAGRLRALGDFPITVHKVLPIADAVTNNVAYRHIEFDPKVLTEHCPNRGQISYICGRGFSLCCSNLAFNGSRGGVVHPTLSEHIESPLFKSMSEHNFSELLTRAGIRIDSLAPEMSSACTLCEKIFCSETKQR